MKAEARDLIDAMPLPAVLIRWDERIDAANAEATALLGEGLAGRHFITVLRQPVLLDAIEGTVSRRAHRARPATCRPMVGRTPPLMWPAARWRSRKGRASC